MRNNPEHITGTAFFANFNIAINNAKRAPEVQSPGGLYKKLMALVI
jgi:hypothetical protein